MFIIKKPRYIILFVAFFVICFLYNSLWFGPDYSAIIVVILVSLVESFILYLIAILIILIINTYNR